jgi:transposase InsO family protein
MSHKAYCWDNIVSESFFHTLNTECVNHENYQSSEAAKKSIFDTIEVFYNRQRLHSNNGYLSPVEFEMQLKSA